MLFFFVPSRRSSSEYQGLELYGSLNTKIVLKKNQGLCTKSPYKNRKICFHLKRTYISFLLLMLNDEQKQDLNSITPCWRFQKHALQISSINILVHLSKGTNLALLKTVFVYIGKIFDK